MDVWKQFQDFIPSFDDTSLKSNSFLEQMNTTKDESDYLWYTHRLVIWLHFWQLNTYHSLLLFHFLFTLILLLNFEVTTEVIDFVNRFENNLSCSKPILSVQSAAHVAHAFVNNTYIGT